MSLDVLKARLKGDFGGTYIFYGDNEYTKDYYFKLLRSKAVDLPADDFNYIKYNSDNLDVSELNDFTMSFPFTGGHKFAEIRCPDFLKMNEKDAEQYASIISELPEYVVLVLFFRGFELEEKDLTPTKKAPSPLLEALKKHAVAVNFTQPDHAQTVNWLCKHFTTAKVEIERTVPDAIISMCGTDLYILRGETEKLCAAYKGKPLTTADVANYCCSNIAYQTFDLSNALAEKDAKKVSRIFTSLVAKKTEPLLIMGALIKNVSDMVAVKEGQECGISPSAMASELKTTPWAVMQRLNALKRRTPEYARNALALCAECDKKLKGFSVNSYLALDLLLQSLLI